MDDTSRFIHVLRGVVITANRWCWERGAIGVGRKKVF